MILILRKIFLVLLIKCSISTELIFVLFVFKISSKERKNIVKDLGLEDPQVKHNLFEYSNPVEYLIAYGKIVNHVKFKSLQYFSIAKKALKRYQDFLFESKI